MERPRETSIDRDGRLEFRLTCRRHRATFVEILEREGVSDEAEMERLRRGFAALVMKTYPGGYLHHIAEASCMGSPSSSRGRNVGHGRSRRSWH